MLKSILDLKGVQQLTVNEQKFITGSKELQIADASFPCYCNGVYKQDCGTVQCCISACGL